MSARTVRNRTARRLSWLMVAGLTAGALLVPAASSVSATQGEDHKVNVCHATDSDTNPYELIGVDVASTAFQGHLGHRNDPNKEWKSDGTYNGVAHVDGQAKPDLIEGLDAGVPPYPADGKDAEAMCGLVPGQPSEQPSEEPSEQPSEEPTGEVDAETGTPAATLPPTDTISATPSAPTSDGLQVVLLGMAGILAGALLLTPATKRNKR